MGFYYPEGYFGPVCDSPVSDEDIANRSRRAIIIEDLDQEKEVLTGMIQLTLMMVLIILIQVYQFGRVLFVR